MELVDLSVPVTSGMGHFEGTPPVFVHARTDAAGRFALEVPAEAVARGTSPPRAVWAATSGRDVRVAFHRHAAQAALSEPRKQSGIGVGGGSRGEIRALDGSVFWHFGLPTLRRAIIVAIMA